MKILAPLPKGIEDTPENRAKLQAACERAIPTYDIRKEAKAGNINAYGDYTIENWFSAAEGDPYDETFSKQGTGRSFQCMSFGLAGEVGEVMEKLKKIVRDGTFEPEALKKELGDVQFYLVRLMRYFGWEPSDVLGTNIDKLDDRRARGTMRGSGDNR